MKTHASSCLASNADLLSTCRLQRKLQSALSAKGGDSESEENENNPLLKASWYAVEAFGKVFGKQQEKNGSLSKAVATAVKIDTSRPPSSLSETFLRLQDDNAREYFLSGEIDQFIYDPNCVFADPFVSFKGRDRFIDNLANLGSFITEYSAKPITYSEDKSNSDGTKPQVTTKFMVKLRLNLPWKPVLAWPWGVRCEIDPSTFQIVLHEESWDIEPLEGVKQIFREPTTLVK